MSILVAMSKHLMKKSWPSPKIRGVGFFSDSSIYLEVLKYAVKVEYFTKIDLMNILSNRVRGLLFSKNMSKTAINNLVVELREFGWIEHFLKTNINSVQDKYLYNDEVYKISNVGFAVYTKSLNDQSYFYDTIIGQLNEIYSTPGWFVQRLWDLNSEGQGQIVIPSPPKGWNPSRRHWNDNQWSEELTQIVSDAYQKIQNIIPAAFPIVKDVFLESTKDRWVEIGNAKPRKDIDVKKNNGFTPRKRLALAMRESVIRILFQNKNPRTGINDFNNQKEPLLPRTYAYWCSRLEELGLINYTDYNPNIQGRLIYPISTFNTKSTKMDLYSILSNVRNLEQKPLLIFRPSVENDEIRKIFLETLFEEYNQIYKKTRSLYISSQDLRDEVCRVLKFSSHLFDSFLEKIVNISINGAIKYRISLETDVREDQQSRAQMQRKPVYYNKRIISLIAITYAN